MKFTPTEEKFIYKYGVIFTGVISGSLITWILMSYVFNNNYPTDISAIRQNDKNTPLIRPLLGYNTPEIESDFALKDKLKKIIDTYTNNNQLNATAVYYRDLNTGKWFGINQDETFTPASLFKVPLMITYLKDAEIHPRLLSTEITNNLVRDENEKETIKPLKSIVEGVTYTVDELLHYMIEYSDNNATVLLFKYVDQDTLSHVFSDLDIQLPSENINSDFISVSNYSFLFRVLYNATYLNHEMSEKGLEMLSKIDFTDGIRKSLPTGVPFADKFGEYYLIENGKIGEHQLHDCGIVYHPKHPYLLCVMTKGDSLDNLKKIIQEISKSTYVIVNNLK